MRDCVLIGYKNLEDLEAQFIGGGKDVQTLKEKFKSLKGSNLNDREFAKIVLFMGNGGVKKAISKSEESILVAEKARKTAEKDKKLAEKKERPSNGKTKMGLTAAEKKKAIAEVKAEAKTKAEAEAKTKAEAEAKAKAEAEAKTKTEDS